MWLTLIKAAKSSGYWSTSERPNTVPHERFQCFDKMLDGTGHGVGVEREAQPDAFCFGEGQDKLSGGFDLDQVVQLSWAMPSNCKPDGRKITSSKPCLRQL
jgi:hypothetical protein